MFGRIWKDIKNYWLAIVMVIVFYFLMHMLFDAFCPSVIIWGLPCPGCGLTRSVLFFLTGQWARSFAVHPLGWSVVVLALYIAVFRYIMGKKIPALKWIIIVLLVGAILLFMVRMYLYFPDRPPYTYNHGNLIERIWPAYGRLWH